MGANEGAAREVGPGRLAAFEDGEVDEPITLPARPRRQQVADHSSGIGTDTPRDPAAPATGPATPPLPDPGDPSEGIGRVGRTSPDRVRPSNVHVPVALLEPIAQACSDGGLSHGEVIITAIEATYARLPELIHPTAMAGGSLFAARRSRASRSTDGPLTPLNYRLREADFKTLDDLVQELRASSRGHLITTALTAYFEERTGAQ